MNALYRGHQYFIKPYALVGSYAQQASKNQNTDSCILSVNAKIFTDTIKEVTLYFQSYHGHMHTINGKTKQALPMKILLASLHTTRRCPGCKSRF